MLIDGAVPSTQHRELVGGYEHLETVCAAETSTQEPPAFEREHHLMDGRRDDREESLRVSLGRGASIDLGVGVNEGQIPAL